MEEADNIIRILKETKVAVTKKDIPLLRELSNQTVHTASIAQDSDNIAIAVIVYSLGKILERGDEEKVKNFYEKYNQAADKEISALSKHNDFLIKAGLEEIRKLLTKTSGKMKGYIEEVFRKASINKASKIYEHGISMERTASLLGITIWELANYAGQRADFSEDKSEKTISTKDRIKLAMEIFSE
jgi:hypothetical protein